MQPGTPAFLPPLQGRRSEPDRYDLARWLVAPDNPLTARVAVNAIWQQLFGRGLVATPENFGLQGEAAVASRAARLAGDRILIVRLEPQGPDPPHRHLGDLPAIVATPERPRRARPGQQPCWRGRTGSGSRPRWSATSAWPSSGLLNSEMGGPSVQPPLPASLLNRPEFKSERLMAPSRGAERYRRGVYVNVQRTFAYPMFKDFDSADPSAACPRRDRSNTPLQALTLLNDPAFAECSPGHSGSALVRECRGELRDAGPPRLPDRSRPAARRRRIEGPRRRATRPIGPCTPPTRQRPRSCSETNRCRRARADRKRRPGSRSRGRS